MHINDKNWGKLKWSITGIVCGNNTTKHIAISYTGLSFPNTKVHKHLKIGVICICTVFHNGLLAWEFGDLQRDDPCVRWSACARNNTFRNHNSPINTCATQSYEQCSPFIFLPSCDVHMRSLHTQLSLLFPKNSLLLFCQPEAVCFSLYAGIPVCTHLFPQTGERKTKT